MYFSGISISVVSVVLLQLPTATHSVKYKAEAIMCGKIPHIPDTTKCNEGKRGPLDHNVKSSDYLEFKVVELPFDESRELWLHVHVGFDDATAPRQTFKTVALMAQNILGYPIGEWVDELPCEIRGGSSPGLKNDVYNLNSRVAKNIRTVDCPKTPYSSDTKPPNFLSMEFLQPRNQDSFHATVKLSLAEKISVEEYFRSSGGSGIRFVISYTTFRGGVCFINHYSEFYVIKEKLRVNCDTNKNNIPVECHRCAQSGAVVKALDTNADFPDSRLMTGAYKILMGSNSAGPKEPERPPYPITYEELITKYLDKSKEQPTTTTTKTTTTTTILTKTTTATALITTTSNPSVPKATVAPGVPERVNTIKPPDINDNTAFELIEIPKNGMYSECERTKGCIGQPPGCLATRMCSSILSYTEETNKVAFQLFGKSEKYVAMGFSEDKLMGHDSVIECVRESGNVVRAYRSYNTLNKDNKRLKDHSPISQIKGKYEHGEIYCEFLYPRQTFVEYEEKNVTYDLEKQKYYVLHVEGHFARDGLGGNIGYHSETFVGEHKVNLMGRFGKSPVQLIFGKMHGMIMIIVWFGIFPVSNFLPRYFKETWTEYYIRGYTWWYFIHVILAGLTVFLTTFATFGLTISLHGWGTYPWHVGFHLIAGFIINALIIIDVFLGYVVVKFNSPFRYYSINFMHGFIGHVVFFLSYVTIFISRNIESGMPCISTDSMIGFMVVILVIHFFMNYQVCYTDFVQGRYTSRVYYSCGTLDLPGKTVEGEAPVNALEGALCRKVLLVLFVVICLIFTLILCVLYGHPMYLDCKEEARIRAIEDEVAEGNKQKSKYKVKV